MKRSTAVWAPLAWLVAALGGFVMNRLGDKPETITLIREVEGIPLELVVTPGPEWSRRMQAGPFVFNVLPQIVAWVEDEEGVLVDTLYVTGAGGTGVRHAQKKSKGSLFYRECFPVWASRLEAAGGRLPGPDNPYTDALTSATPSSAFTVRTRIPATDALLTIYLEINQSGDTNATYTDKSNGWAGQPSVIYAAPLGAGGEVTLAPVGHGGALGAPAGIHPDLSSLDTALRQVSEIRVRVGG